MSDSTTPPEQTLDFDDETLRAIAEVYNNEGDSEYSKGEYTSAINQYTEGIKVNCKDENLNASLFTNRATVHLQLGNHQEAVSDAEAARKLQPSFIKAIERGANAHVKLNRFEEAIKWCDEGLAEIDKENSTLLELRNNSLTRSKTPSDTVKNNSGTGNVDDKTDRVDKSSKEELINRADQGTRDPAIDAHLLDLRIAKEEEDKAREGSAYAKLGFAYYSLGDFHKAVEYFQLYLKYTKEVGYKDGESCAYSSLGIVYRYLNDINKSIQYHQFHLSIAKQLDDKASEGRAYGNLGNCYSSMGEFTKAIEYHNLGLVIAKEVGDRGGEGRGCDNLGGVYATIGDFQSGIMYYRLHLSIVKQLEDKASEGRAYGKLGNCYLKIGDFTKAIEYHNLGLAIAKEIGDRAEEVRAYANLANGYFFLRDFKEATEHHQQSLSIAKELGNEAAERDAYVNLASIYRELGDFKKAIEYHLLHLNLAKKLEDRDGEKKAYANLGYAYDSLCDFKKALQYYQLHLSIAKDVGDKSAEGSAYSKLGATYRKLSDFKKALECHELHLNIAKQIEDRAGEGSANGNLGNCYYSLGDFKKAVDFHLLHLSIAKEVGDIGGEGRACCNLGVAYRYLGDFKTAIDYHQLHLSIAKQLGDRSGEGSANGNIGNCFFSLGDVKSAIDYHNESLGIAREVGDRYAEGCEYDNIGIAYSSLGDFESAIENHQEHLRITTSMGDRAGEARAYVNLGVAYDSLGNTKKAIEYYQQSLIIDREVGDRAGEGKTCSNLGAAYFSIEEFQKALQYYQLSLNIAKEVRDKNMEASAYASLGNACRHLGDLFKAEDFYKSSVRLFDFLRSELKSKDEWKISFRNHHKSTYNALWMVLLQQNKIEEALLTAERGRGQALMDLMETQYGLESDQPKPAHEMERVADILSYISPPTVFIALGKSTINFWVLQKGNDFHFVQREFEKQYFKENATSSLVSLNEDAYSKIGVLKSVKCEDRTLQEPKIEDLSSQKRVTTLRGKDDPLNILYDVVIGPIADIIHGNNEITIVPDGPLFLAPFPAFVDKNSKYLSETFTVRLIPTLTSLKMMATCPEGYHSSTGALLVGDPWVQSVRIEIKEQNKGKKKGEKKGKAKVKTLPQLPAAKAEVEMIGTILGIEPLTGKEATKEEVLKRLPSVALVHIAAHGKAETGEIALSPNSEQSSEIPKEEDYLLTMKDVESVRMQAKLVVLSCCHSGRGEIKAEGVVGIARAFLGAGARSVLASLWAISDEATRDFMRHFYSHLADGLSASKCLNQAMKVMRESERFSRVEHWAPFVLIGDDVTLDFGHKRIAKSEPLEEEAST